MMARQIWNAKAKSPEIIIMWFGSLLGVLIAIVWLMQNVSVDHITIEKLNQEATSLQTAFSNACNVDYFMHRYNPRMDKGYLIISDSHFCVDGNKCRPLYYSSQNDYALTNGTIFIENATLCDTPNNCNTLYYTGDSMPVVNGNITINDSVLCKDITSGLHVCRMSLCSLDTNTTINLKNITYLNIVRENETFNITTE